MLNNPMVLAAITAIGFGGWPLIVRNAGLSTIWLAILVSLGSFLAVMAGSPTFNFGGTPSSRALMIGLFAGLLNGTAFLTYSKLIVSQEWNLSVYIPMVVGMMLLIPVIGGVTIFAEPITPSKTAGVIAILVGIWLLR